MLSRIKQQHKAKIKKGAGMKICRIGRGIGCFFVVSLCTAVYAKQQINYLNKAFYYSGRADEVGTATNIDCGRFVLLFNEKPQITVLPDTHKNNEQAVLTVLFPYAAVEKECEKMVKELNAATCHHCTFRLEKIDKPISGLRFSMTYDPRRVGVDHRRLETIKYDRGLEIRMFDREVLDLLKKTEAPRIAYSHADGAKKKQSFLILDTVAMTREQLLTA
jgi:hypothetical protein